MFSMKITDTEDLNKAVQTIVTDVGKVSEFTLKRCAKVVQTRVEGNLHTLEKQLYNQKGYPLKRPREIHMSQDVIIRFTKDRYGYRIVKVQGGKQTGTLWHIVNDGTYKNSATHFMDNAIAQSEKEIESILDQELRKVF